MPSRPGKSGLPIHIILWKAFTGMAYFILSSTWRGPGTESFRTIGAGSTIRIDLTRLNTHTVSYCLTLAFSSVF